MNSSTSFRDLSTLTTVVTGALVVYLGVSCVALWSDWLELDLLYRVVHGSVVSQREAEVSDARQGLIGGIQFLLLVATAVAFLRWTYLSNGNARALGATDMEFTPGWSVGWYFVPFATLWKPYQAMKEMFQASHPDFHDDWRHAPSPGVLRVWWGFWLVSNGLGQVVLRTSLRAESIEQHLSSSRLIFAADALDVPLTLLAITVVTRLSRAQAEKHRRLWPVAMAV